MQTCRAKEIYEFLVHAKALHVRLDPRPVRKYINQFAKVYAYPDGSKLIIWHSGGRIAWRNADGFILAEANK